MLDSHIPTTAVSNVGGGDWSDVINASENTSVGFGNLVENIQEYYS